jgi:hypothetical protein
MTVAARAPNSPVQMPLDLRASLCRQMASRAPAILPADLEGARSLAKKGPARGYIGC